MCYMRIKWEIIVATESIEIVISICELNTYPEMYTRFAMVQVDLPIFHGYFIDSCPFY